MCLCLPASSCFEGERVAWIAHLRAILTESRVSGSDCICVWGGGGVRAHKKIKKLKNLLDPKFTLSAKRKLNSSLQYHTGFLLGITESIPRDSPPVSNPLKP